MKDNLLTSFIIIRGNSGSGKTTLASALRSRLLNVLIISQDVVRREMLGIKDTPGNLAIDLIEAIAKFGSGTVPFVIIEGIMVRDRYLYNLMEIQKICKGVYIPVYLNISLPETIKRHKSRAKRTEFSEDELVKWRVENDTLGIPNEIVFTDSHSLSDMIEVICMALNANVTPDDNL